jgi:glucuronokinase
LTASASGRAFARAALLGNPSDLHGGCVLAFTCRDFAAEARVGAPADDHAALIRAALDSLAEHTGDDAARSLEINGRTTIPREVGLGSSSAMVIATVRAATAELGLRLSLDELAEVALRAERDHLGIAAGPQDRVVQSYEGLVLMDFAAGSMERLDANLLPPVFVAWREDAAEHSGRVHAGVDSDEGAAHAVMTEIAALARQGAAALRSGSPASLVQLLRRNLELRAELYDLDPRHLRMVEIAREHGTEANYAGSGGAITGLVPGEGLDELRDAFAAEGCDMVQPTIAAAGN